MLKEFKEFALKGNMVDMAVGIIMGGAFGLVVKSLVDNIIMPLVFINSVINLLIIALALFIGVKYVVSAMEKKEEEVEEPDAQETLLTEIRDLLKK